MVAIYIALLDYTKKGVENIKDSPRRGADFIDTAKRHGVTVKEEYWTVGGHDGVLILESDDDEGVAALLLGLAAAGNVRTQTLRAYDRAGMQAIVGKMD